MQGCHKLFVFSFSYQKGGALTATLYMIHLISRKGVTVKKDNKKKHRTRSAKDVRKMRIPQALKGRLKSPLTPTLLLQAWRVGHP